MISEHLCHRITAQFRRHAPDPELNNNNNNNNNKQIKSTKNNRQKKILEIIRNEMSSDERKQANLSRCLTLEQKDHFCPNLGHKVFLKFQLY